jgi:hypothetical protein
MSAEQLAMADIGRARGARPDATGLGQRTSKRAASAIELMRKPA